MVQAQSEFLSMKNPNWFNCIEKLSTFYSDYIFAWVLRKLFNVYLFLKERERVQAEEEQRERHRIRSMLQAVSTEPDSGLKPTNCKITTWTKVRGLTDWDTQAPLHGFIYLSFLHEEAVTVVTIFLRQFILNSTWDKWGFHLEHRQTEVKQGGILVPFWLWD